MEQVALIEGGVVVNVSMVERVADLPGWVPGGGAAIGDTYHPPRVDPGGAVVPGSFTKMMTVPDPGTVRDAAKLARQHAVDTIVVTIDGMTFDGDELSQARMARAAQVMEFASLGSIRWKLSSNEWQDVTAAQLLKACAAAGTEQLRIWEAESVV